MCAHLSTHAPSASAALPATPQYVRRLRLRGLWRSATELLLRRGETETDKWALLWGRPPAAAGALHRARVLLLPSLPERRKLGPGVGHSRAWLGAAALLAGLLMLAPLLASALEAVARGGRRR